MSKQFHEFHLAHLINKQFEIAGHKVEFDNVKGPENDGWYQKYTTTKEKENEFLSYIRTYLNKNNIYPKPFREQLVQMFILNWGLRLDDSI